jgi:glycosyltransferase involved in cell wall biosynthesis
MTVPLVTAAFTACNAQETILPALASAMAQDWPTLEILVVDDASSDNTPAMVETYIRDQSEAVRPVRLIRQSYNGGVAQTRNRLIAEARGEFIAFFDDDDVSAPDRTSRQYARILETEAGVGHDLILCHTAREQIFPGGRSHYEATMGCEGIPTPVGTDVADRILLGRLSPGVIGSCATCSQMARRSVYTRLGGFDSTLSRAEDTDLNIRCALQGGAFAGVAAPLVRQAMTTGIEKGLLAEFESYAALQDKYRDYLASHGWLDFTLRWREIRRDYMQRRMGLFFLRLFSLSLHSPVKLAKKMYWSLPAHRTRRYLRYWHHTAFPHSAPGSDTP